MQTTNDYGAPPKSRPATRALSTDLTICDLPEGCCRLNNSVRIIRQPRTKRAVIVVRARVDGLDILERVNLESSPNHPEPKRDSIFQPDANYDQRTESGLGKMDGLTAEEVPGARGRRLRRAAAGGGRRGEGEDWGK